jgi:hypothetical protein
MRHVVHLQTHKAKEHKDERRTGEFRDRSNRSLIGEGRITHNGTSKGQCTYLNNTKNMQ